jgi:hypothetical protein
MHTRRSFLAFAAAAQVIGPVARAMQVRDARAMAARLPAVLLQTRPGRDVYFCNDPMSGRLAILNLQYADNALLGLPPARQVPGLGTREAYLYSLTLQPAIGNPTDLRRWMERYASGGAWPAPEEVELVRLRLGMYNGK